jgi:hypothetical protein
MGFSYAVQDLVDDTDNPNHRSLDLPFGDDVDTTEPATRGQMQCMAVDGDTTMTGAQNVDLYPYMAFGGDSPTYDVTMTMEGEDDTVMDVAHQFMITMNDKDIAELSGQPNTAAGIHNWILNARDSASDQHKVRSWKLRVVQEPYDGDNITTVTAEDPIIDDTTVVDWADFVSAEFDGDGTLGDDDVRGGTAASLNLSDSLQGETPGSGMVPGTINEAVDEVSDVDVFWVGSLTPDSVLNVMVDGKFESPNAPGVYNDVSVALYSHVPGATRSDAETPGTSEMEGYDEYKGVDCNFYYLEVSGDEGSYELSWTFTE